jgi:hypothetical protein
MCAVLRLRSLWVGLVFALVVGSGNQAAAQPRPPAGDADMTAQDKQMLEWATECATRISKTLESWITNRKISEQKLFAYLYYPIARTDPPKFHTDYDERLSDMEVGPLQEEYYRKSADIKYVRMVDRNGYTPTHNVVYSQPPTGLKQVDLVKSRSKRIFNDRTGIRAARNTAPYLVQWYNRDTGDIVKDLSVPIRVNGKHFGALRLGYIPRRTQVP